MPKKNKTEIINNSYEQLNDSQGVIVADYRGTDVSSMSELRNQLREKGSSATVQKNTLTKIVFNKLKLEYPDEMLKGPSIVINSKKEPVLMSKVIVDFAKSNENFTIKGGFLDSEYLSVDSIDELAKLPTKPELIAKTVGLIKAPLTGLVSTLSSPVNGFINVLDNIKNKKQ